MNSLYYWVIYLTLTVVSVADILNQVIYVVVYIVLSMQDPASAMELTCTEETVSVLTQ